MSRKRERMGFSLLWRGSLITSNNGKEKKKNWKHYYMEAQEGRKGGREYEWGKGDWLIRGLDLIMWSEGLWGAQREKNLGSRVTLLPGKFLPSGKFFYIYVIFFCTKSGIFLDSMENFHLFWKCFQTISASGQVSNKILGKNLFNLEHFQIV